MSPGAGRTATFNLQCVWAGPSPSYRSFTKRRYYSPIAKCVIHSKIFLDFSYFVQLENLWKDNNIRFLRYWLNFATRFMVVHHTFIQSVLISLQWRHNECNGVSNRRHLDCLFNCLFRRGSKKLSKLRVAGLCEANSRVTGEIPVKGPVTRKMFQFDDVIM